MIFNKAESQDRLSGAPSDKSARKKAALAGSRARKLRLVDPAHLINREISQLEFNRRVLAQAEDAEVPLLERLRFLCIVSSNLDEFFEVRFADMLDAQRDGSGLVTPRDVERVGRAAHDLIDQQYAIFNDQVMPALREHNIQILNHADRTDEIRAWVSKFFEREVRPLLVPVGLDPAHPFPQVANKSLHFIARLSGKDALGRDNRIAIVKVPRVLPRVIKVPAAISGGKQSFVLLTSVIRAHLEELFPGRHVEAFSQFRVTRDSDLEVDEEEIANLRHALRSGANPTPAVSSSVSMLRSPHAGRTRRAVPLGKAHR